MKRFRKIPTFLNESPLGTFFELLLQNFLLTIRLPGPWARVVKGRTQREWLVAKIPLPETPLLLPE